MDVDPPTADPERAQAVMDLLHVRTGRLAPGDPVAEPLVGSSTFALGEDPAGDAVYSRYGNPNLNAAEERLACVDGAPCVLSASGMAAIAGVLIATCRQGDRVVLPSDGYFHSRVLIAEVLAPLGVEAVTVPTRELVHADLGGAAIVLCESPSNPALELVDLPALADRCRDADAVLCVDNTLMTGLLQRPLDLGADVVVAADTKAAGGHSDLVLGHAATRDAELEQRLRDIRKFTGAVPGPFETWLLSRSLETLDLRLERMCANAAALADLLVDHGVGVTYPGRSEHPDAELAARQMRSPGFVLGATFPTQATAEAFRDGMGLVDATSFGGAHSSADRRARWGDAVPEGFLRISAGIEPTEPLLDRAADALRSPAT